MTPPTNEHIKRALQILNSMDDALKNNRPISAEGLKANIES